MSAKFTANAIETRRRSSIANGSSASCITNACAHMDSKLVALSGGLLASEAKLVAPLIDRAGHLHGSARHAFGVRPVGRHSVLRHAKYDATRLRTAVAPGAKTSARPSAKSKLGVVQQTTHKPG